jgi:hypothetical protein
MYLFDINNREITYTKLLNNLDVLCNKFPSAWNVDPWYVLNKHTEYPLYLVFHREKQGINLKCNYKNAVKLLSDINSSQFRMSSMQVCPKCYEEQIQKYGEAFLNKYHQDSIVKYCYKHGVPLRTYKKSLDYRDFYDLNCLDIQHDFEVDESIIDIYSNHQIDFSKIYKDILDGQLLGFDLSRVKASFNAMLGEKGYKNGNYINLAKLS